MNFAHTCHHDAPRYTEVLPENWLRYKPAWRSVTRMRADKLTVNGLFDPTERRDALLFQRPYVWKREENWAPYPNQ